MVQRPGNQRSVGARLRIELKYRREQRLGIGGQLGIRILAQHTLGLAGGPGGILHDMAEAGVRDVIAGVAIQQAVVGFATGDLTPDGNLDPQLARSGQTELRGLGNANVGKQGHRVAIFNYIGNFLFTEVPVDCGQACAQPVRGKTYFNKFRAVAAEKRDGLPALEAPFPQQMGDLVGALIELPETAIAVPGQDRGSLGVQRRDSGNLHALRGAGARSLHHTHFKL